MKDIKLILKIKKIRSNYKDVLFFMHVLTYKKSANFKNVWWSYLLEYMCSFCSEHMMAYILFIVYLIIKYTYHPEIIEQQC